MIRKLLQLDRQTFYKNRFLENIKFHTIKATKKVVPNILRLIVIILHVISMEIMFT